MCFRTRLRSGDQRTFIKYLLSVEIFQLNLTEIIILVVYLDIESEKQWQQCVVCIQVV